MKHIVFIIDDDYLMLEMLKSALDDLENIMIYTFMTGEDALVNIDLKPEIILLDYLLNSVNEDAMNGLTVLKQLKQYLPDSKVFILSGQEDLEVIYKLNQYNADNYFIKDENAIVNVKNTIKNMIKN